MMKAIISRNQAGVIGCEGSLPWETDEDISWSNRITKGATLVVGSNTARTIKHDNMMILGHGHHSVEDIIDMSHFIDLIVVGGAKTFASLSGSIDEWYVSEIPGYADGDCFFDKNWITQPLADSFELRNHVIVNIYSSKTA